MFLRRFLKRRRRDMISALPRNVLLKILETFVDDREVSYEALCWATSTLPRVSRLFWYLFTELETRNLHIYSRDHYYYYIAKLKGLSRESTLNTGCACITFMVKESQYVEYLWYMKNRLTKGRFKDQDPIGYFMGNELTKAGLFPNLCAVRLRCYGIIVDPYNALFPFCLPKTVKTVQISYGFDPITAYNAPLIKRRQRLTRTTPIRYPGPKHFIDTLTIDGPMDNVKWIARIWASLFTVDSKSVIVNGKKLRPPRRGEPLQVWSLDIDEALKMVMKRDIIEWDWEEGRPFAQDFWSSLLDKSRDYRTGQYICIPNGGGRKLVLGA
ncbi:hypothetical protein M422DRAFT_244727 [Sphaerobolus stellatus SS14]|nr:hypothetical protein M422DRAFT_244727 [Sphaerobolus stellatus SS14]